MSHRDNILVVTGTDTEIGKTTVACGLVRGLVDRGVDVRAIKPVESGIDELAVEQRDGVRLAEAARQEEPGRALTELTRPLAPPEAAEIDGVELDYDAWVATVEEASRSADLVIVEGAGGLLSPLTWQQTARDLAVDLQARVLLVAPDALGVLNHSLMAYELLESAGLEVAGIVFSRSTEGDESTDKNPRTFRRFSGFDRVAALPRIDGWRDGVEHLETPIGWVSP